MIYKRSKEDNERRRTFARTTQKRQEDDLKKLQNSINKSNGGKARKFISKVKKSKGKKSSEALLEPNDNGSAKSRSPEVG
mmetsp:Transcript_15912/g.24564  ORF Transcript_15912/g.24564 Transcript_15912/m.24564 type:complete len:80 (-) Transcript_15912:112-351(-)